MSYEFLMRQINLFLNVGYLSKRIDLDKINGGLGKWLSR